MEIDYQFVNNLRDVVLMAAVVIGVEKLVKWDRAKRIWIIEDSPTDMMLLKQFIDAPDVAFTYISSVDEFRKKFLSPWRFKKPDGVIADYHLDRGFKGTQITSLCKQNGIDCLLITGDDKEILGINEEQIVRKAPGTEWYDKISNWILKRGIRHG